MRGSHYRKIAARLFLPMLILAAAYVHLLGLGFPPQTTWPYTIPGVLLTLLLGWKLRLGPFYYAGLVTVLGICFIEWERDADSQGNPMIGRYRHIGIALLATPIPIWLLGIWRLLKSGSKIVPESLQ